ERDDSPGQTARLRGAHMIHGALLVEGDTGLAEDVGCRAHTQHQGGPENLADGYLAVAAADPEAQVVVNQELDLLGQDGEQEGGDDPEDGYHGCDREEASAAQYRDGDGCAEAS